jgi:hypothetical protein
MTHTHENIALVEVPEGSKPYAGKVKDGVFRSIGKWYAPILIPLPPGSWRFVCLSTEMTEEKAREVVEAVTSDMLCYRCGGFGQIEQGGDSVDCPLCESEGEAGQDQLQSALLYVERHAGFDYWHSQDKMFGTWKEAWNHLLTAIGCDPAGTYAVLKNERV